MFTDKKYNKIIFPVIVFLALAVDRISKYLAVTKLQNAGTVNVIGDIFQFVYAENMGAAFGMLQGKHTLFYIITAIVILLILYFLYKIPKERYYLRIAVSVCFIFAGALGNLIDRLKLGYVIDFIYFRPINFPVFNFADICVTLGTIAFAILVLFVYRDHDFDFIAPGKRDAD